MITLPIIVIDKKGNDLSVWESLEAAENHLEPIDVSMNEYVAYDALGRLLNLGIEIQKKCILFDLIPIKRKYVRIYGADTDPECSDELRMRLIGYLKALKHNEQELQGKALMDLISLAKSE